MEKVVVIDHRKRTVRRPQNIQREAVQSMKSKIEKRVAPFEGEETLKSFRHPLGSGHNGDTPLHPRRISRQMGNERFFKE